MAEHNNLGRWGEEKAVEHLVKEGYAIVERNWRMGHMEIDIIASKGDEIVFVEVKTRRAAESFGALAIDREKVRHLSRAADRYMQNVQTNLRPRYDVICVNGEPGGELKPGELPMEVGTYKIEHMVDAIRPPLRTYR